MICPRCSTKMICDEEGHPYCYPCSESVPRLNLGPEAAMAAIRAVHDDAALRQLRERVARLESAVADLKRRIEPPKATRPRFLGAIGESEPPARYCLDETRPSFASLVKPADDAPPFLGEIAEEPSPEEPGERR